MGDDTSVLLSKLEELQDSVDGALNGLKDLRSANRMSQLKFWIVGAVCVLMLVLTWYVWNSARDARNDLAQKFEEAQVENCETSQDGRVRLRGVFQLLFSQAAASSDNPEEVQRFVEEFNDSLIEAVPDRDCAQEARERRG